LTNRLQVQILPRSLHVNSLKDLPRFIENLGLFCITQVQPECIPNTRNGWGVSIVTKDSLHGRWRLSWQEMLFETNIHKKTTIIVAK